MRNALRSFSEFIHHHLLLFLLAMYASAIAMPHFGRAIRDLKIAPHFTLTQFMLGFLLFVAGLGVSTVELRHFGKHIRLVASALIANSAFPILMIGLFASASPHIWHNSREIQVLIVGLTIIAAMPIAGSSTAWAQNSGGSLAASLALVVLSTVLSPFTSALTFGLAEQFVTGGFVAAITKLESSGTVWFLIWSVIVPSALGIATRQLLGEGRTMHALPALKSLNLINLLILNYSNASTSLPQVIAHPDYDFLLPAFGVTSVLCASGYLAGWMIGALSGADKSARTSTLFGLGMNNNGTGLVLVTTQLKAFPELMLPLIFFNLEQQIIAGVVDSYIDRKSARAAAQRYAAAARDDIPLARQNI